VFISCHCQSVASAYRLRINVWACDTSSLMDRIYDVRSAPTVRVMETGRSGAVYDDPTMDVGHVRLDLHRQFTVLLVVFGNDVSISVADARHDNSRRLRRGALRRSSIVVHLLAAEGDWLFRVCNLGPRVVRGHTKMASAGISTYA